MGGGLTMDFHVLIIAVILGVEYWLGKTKKVKAGSLLEIVFMLSLTLFVYIKEKFDEH
jgi:hypothetical protein